MVYNIQSLQRFSPSSSMFPTMCRTTESLSGITQCLLEDHPLVASIQGQLGFQRQCLPLQGLALQIIRAKTLTTLLLKLQTYPQIIFSTPFLSFIQFGASYHFVLKPLTNSKNQDPIPSGDNIAPPSLLLKYSQCPYQDKIIHSFVTTSVTTQSESTIMKCLLLEISQVSSIQSLSPV